MSLFCDETGRDIEFGATLRAGTRTDVDFYSALSDEVIRQIPDSEKSRKPRKVGSGGLDIHEASSSKNFNSAYTVRDFQLGDFLFSISQETAEKFLPKHLKRYQKE